MKDFEDALKIAGQGLLTFFLLLVMSIIFNSSFFATNIDFNPFANLLNISVIIILLIMVALFVVFVVWIIKEILEAGGIRI